MHALRQPALRSQLRSPGVGLLIVALALSLVRANDQPAIDVGIGGTTASVGAQDVVLVALGIAAIAVLARRRVERELWPVAAAAGAFCVLLLGTAAANGATAIVSGGKLVELSALTLGVAAFVRSRTKLEAIVDVLLVFTIAADAFGLVRFVASGGGRQSSFLGEHDFAALATLPLVYGLTLLFEPQVRRGRAAVAIVAGGLGCILGAALASVVGLYLGAAALIAVAALRRSLDLRRVVLVAAVVAVVTAGTVSLRSGELGFLQQWFGSRPSRPGQYAASWSQRLIYAYVGGRVYLANPVLGTGWWGELPPPEFADYLPAARRRFADQPPRYFPPADRNFIPQQALDQVLYELGSVGGALLLTLFATLVAACVRAARWARDRIAYLPAVWLAATVGALSGEGLFGGAALGTTFWLVIGLVAALPLLAREAT